MAFDFGSLITTAARSRAGYLANKEDAQKQQQALQRQRALDLFNQWAKRQDIGLQGRQLDEQSALRREAMKQTDALTRFRAEMQQSIQDAKDRAALERVLQSPSNLVPMVDAAGTPQIINKRAATAAPVSGVKIPPKTGQGGGMTAAQQATQENRAIVNSDRLMSMYKSEPAVKNAAEIASRVAQMRSAAPGPAGDLNLIFGFMKVLDPTSVVREGEQASAANARGVPGMVRNLHNRVLRGDKLTPEQRTAFIEQANRIAQAQATSLGSIARRYGELARVRGADSASVVGNPFESLGIPLGGRPPIGELLRKKE